VRLAGPFWQGFRLGYLQAHGIALVLCLMGCHLSPATTAAVTTIATVQTIDAGIDVFVKWDAVEEHNISAAAIDACHGLHDAVEYATCTARVTVPRRRPIDAAKSAIRVYREALAAGRDGTGGDFPAVALDVIRALGALGIRVTP